jgi:uncharacterized membrane protein required for colicin V production
MQNILELSRQLNWIDILVFVVILRIGFISLRQGLGVESFKFLGTLCGVYLSLHYYFSFAKFLNGYSSTKELTGTMFELLSFGALFFFGYLFFWSLRVMTFRFVTAEINGEISKWAGFVFGLTRALMSASLLVFVFMLPKEPYFKDSVRYSLSGKQVVTVAPATYTFIWESIVSKFNSGEKYNSAVKDYYGAEAKQKKKNK